MNNDTIIGIGEGIGLIGMIAFYVWIKWIVYSREYKGDTNQKEDRVIRRGNEWD